MIAFAWIAGVYCKWKIDDKPGSYNNIKLYSIEWVHDEETDYAKEDQDNSGSLGSRINRPIGLIQLLNEYKRFLENLSSTKEEYRVQLLLKTMNLNTPDFEISHDEMREMLKELLDYALGKLNSNTPKEELSEELFNRFKSRDGLFNEVLEKLEKVMSNSELIDALESKLKDVGSTNEVLKYEPPRDALLKHLNAKEEFSYDGLIKVLDELKKVKSGRKLLNEILDELKYIENAKEWTKSLLDLLINKSSDDLSEELMKLKTRKDLFDELNNDVSYGNELLSRVLDLNESLGDTVSREEFVLKLMSQIKCRKELLNELVNTLERMSMRSENKELMEELLSNQKSKKRILNKLRNKLLEELNKGLSNAESIQTLLDRLNKEKYDELSNIVNVINIKDNEFTNDTIKNIEKYRKVEVIYLNANKGFDKLPNELLELKNLKHIKVDGEITDTSVLGRCKSLVKTDE